jgi:hypothetical protein
VVVDERLIESLVDWSALEFIAGLALVGFFFFYLMSAKP